MSADRAHWDAVFSNTAPEQVSWHQSQPQRSLQMIAATGITPDRALIDVGCGASRLVDRLLDQGFGDITLNDISPVALAATRERLGARGAAVHWLPGEVTGLAVPAGRFTLWHDRAVFHFLTDAQARRDYVGMLLRALAPGGHVVMATFAAGGPTRCSGLPACQYSAATLRAELGEAFVLRDVALEVHRTPGGATQRFAWFRLQRRAAL